MAIFNEEKLGEEIKKQWGEFGVHYEIFLKMYSNLKEFRDNQ